MDKTSNPAYQEGYTDGMKEGAYEASKQAPLAEAPASVTLSIEIEGFNTLFTIRDMTVSGVYEKTKKMIEIFKADGVKPQVKQSGFQKQAVPVDPMSPLYCKVHKVMMKEKVGNDGNKFVSHSEGVYPNLKWCKGNGIPGQQTEVSRSEW